MTTFAFPAITPTATQIDYRSNTMIFVSPISGSIQTIDRGGERWIMNLQFQNLSGDNRGELMGFLAKLNGQQHRFTLPNHAEPQRGAFGGTPLVAGGSQTGLSLNIDGCSLTVTNWMRAGDWFSVNGELKMATDDISSDGAGLATLAFTPRLRTSPADNAPITTTLGTGTFVLADNGVSWSNSPGGFSDLSIMAIEDINS